MTLRNSILFVSALFIHNSSHAYASGAGYCAQIKAPLSCEEKCVSRVNEDRDYHKILSEIETAWKDQFSTSIEDKYLSLSNPRDSFLMEKKKLGLNFYAGKTLIQAKLCYAKYKGKKDIFVSVSNYKGRNLRLFISYSKNPKGRGVDIDFKVPSQAWQNTIINRTKGFSGTYISAEEQRQTYRATASTPVRSRF